MVDGEKLTVNTKYPIWVPNESETSFVKEALSQKMWLLGNLSQIADPTPFFKRPLPCLKNILDESGVYYLQKLSFL